MKIVFDVDDTISTNHRKLPYDKCIPEKDIIQKINYLHDELHYEIVLHTARGMISCNKDLEKIIAKNKTVLEDWLNRNDVHYDELIFGKPIADLYVDDRAMSVKEFREAEFGLLHGGGSGREIHRLGCIVKKDLGTAEATGRFKDWIEDNEGMCKYPHVISYVYDAVYMDYIEGISLVDCFTHEDLQFMIQTAERFSKVKHERFDIAPHLEILDRNKSNDEEFNEIVEVSKNFLTRNEKQFQKEASYCHGDFTLSNAIKAEDGIYFLDPQYYRNSSTYLLDLAKLRMSLLDYEKLFNLSSASNSMYLEEFDREMEKRCLRELISGLSLMYVCRLYRYKAENQRIIVKNMAKGIIERDEELFR